METFTPTIKIHKNHQLKVVLAYEMLQNILDVFTVHGPRHGPVSISNKRSYRKISWSLKALRFVFVIVWSLWNLTGTSAAAEPSVTISIRCDNIDYQSCGFETLRDLTLRVLSDIETGSWWWAHALHWLHNDHGGVSNHQPRGCLLNRSMVHRGTLSSCMGISICAESCGM